ncbi:MAG: isochorismatase family protein [Methylocystis sp.]|nr:isochorismatase family protein [Methylocystis sp.]
MTSAATRFRPGDALIIVDLQRDFCPGGALPIAGGDDIAPVVNRLVEDAVAAHALVVASRDWHPPGHASFQAQGGPWPEHCVQGGDGAKFHAQLRLPQDAVIVSKGEQAEKDQYSAFEGTGLTDELRRRLVDRVLICGLAQDVCVRATALDAAGAGFKTHVLLFATRPVTPAGGQAAIADMRRAGVVVDAS